VEHTDTLDYAIRKQVRNNPIVREIDEGKAASASCGSRSRSAPRSCWW
jgi:hypothetical protein